MFTWKAFSMAETGPLICTSMPSREPPTTVKPFRFREANHGVIIVPGWDQTAR